jgi:hypothetical protein
MSKFNRLFKKIQEYGGKKYSFEFKKDGIIEGIYARSLYERNLCFDIFNVINYYIDDEIIEEFDDDFDDEIVDKVLDEYSLNIFRLLKCEGGTGTDNMNLIIRSAWEVGYTNIFITDHSNIFRTFPNGEEIHLSLKKINILTTGNTWYSEAFGFKNDDLDNPSTRELIMLFINTNVGEYLSKLKNSDDKSKFKEQLVIFNKFNGFEEQDETKTIMEIFKIIKEQFKKEPIIDSEIKKYNFYTYFTNEIYKRLLKIVGQEEDDFDHFTLTNPNSHESKKGGKMKKSKKRRKNKKSRKSRKNKKSRKSRKNKK